MKSLLSNRAGLLSISAALLCSLFVRPAAGQVCPISLPPSPDNDLTASITIYPGYNIALGVQQQLSSYFVVDVSGSVSGPTPPIPDSIYPAWCVDAWDFITPDFITVPGSVYSGFLYSSCDPNLNFELPPGHPNTLVPPANWQMVNYILNHQGCAGGTNAFYWDVQAAINTLVGSGVGDTNYCGTALTTPIPDGCGGYPTYDPAVVQCLLSQASNAAPTWVPKCGDVYGVIYVTDPSTNQFLLLEVPIPCPTLHIGLIDSCYSSVVAASNAAVAATTSQGGCGGMTYTATVVGTCPATITVTGTDACGDTASTNTTATIFTALPTFSGLPTSPTTSYQCSTEVPPAPTVTATDACGTSLPVSVAITTNQTSACNYVITWTWMTMDCSGQPASFTETVTVQETNAPTLNQGTINTCYTSELSATNAAVAATTGSAYCGGPVTMTVTDNGQSCPMVITVTGTDQCGLSSSITYSTYVLSALPTLSGVPTNNSYQCISEVPAEAPVIGTDSCGRSLVVSVSDVTNVNLGSTCSYTITRSWSVTDCASQPASASQTITVQDTTLPGVTKGSIATCYCSVTTASNAALLATTFTQSLCGGAIKTNVVVSGTCAATITVSGTDACGNIASVTYTTEILTTPPTLTVPTGANYQCLGQVPARAVVTGKDACGGTLTPVVTDVTNGAGLCSYTITRTWKVTDCASQTASGSQVINVQDTALPGVTKGSIATCYASITTASNAALSATTFTPTACGGAVIPKVVVSGTCAATITVTGTDACGKSVSVVYATKILTAPPTLSSYPTGTTVQCASEIPPAPVITATDACGTPLTVTSNQVQSNPGSTCSNVITRTWSAADCANGTVSWTQVITQYDNVAATLTCPPPVTIVTNICQMYCTFSCGDWNGSCNNGHYGNNWWQNWCSQNSPSQCQSSWSGWWGNCGASASQCNNWWNNWNNNNNNGQSKCWGGWSGGSGNNWWNGWNGNSGGNQWVPCNGNNPNSVLQSCFSQVYSNGSVTIGEPGNCITLTSCSAVQNCLGITGNPGSLRSSCVNPSSCSAGSFCAQVLALKLNCDFGNYGCVPGFLGKCGELVLCDSSSPCNGKKVWDILGICNSALSGGSCPSGCTPQYLTTLCSNLNQCFEGCKPSSWCNSHLCAVYVPPPSVTGTPTVSAGCSSSVTLTNIDTITQSNNCPTTYIINREWIAVDSCGNSNTCNQIITIMTKCQNGQICGSFNGQNPGNGYCWLNAHIGCNPGKPCTIYCQNASVTLTCNDGKTYTFPVPDCQVNFQNCNSGSCQFNGKSWETTVPCAGDDQIFLTGCGIPWQSDFANCRSVCWNGTFSCSATNVNCNWQWSGACYKNNIGDCGSVNPKPCHNVPCGFPSGDQCGTPENCKSYCQGGGCGTGGGNYTGSWSSSSSCSF